MRTAPSLRLLLLDGCMLGRRETAQGEEEGQRMQRMMYKDMCWCNSVDLLLSGRRLFFLVSIPLLYYNQLFNVFFPAEFQVVTHG